MVAVPLAETHHINHPTLRYSESHLFNETNAVSAHLAKQHETHEDGKWTAIRRSIQMQQDVGSSSLGRPVWANCSLVEFPGIELLRVSTPVTSEASRQSIYCFLMSHSERKQRIQAVIDTWGTKCDFLLVASNETDPSTNSVKMETEPTYENLWTKLNETIHYIARTTNEFQDYDWYYKVDDDTFVIVENLQSYLQSPQVQESVKQSLPLVYGRNFAFPRFISLLYDENYFYKNSVNEAFKKRFFSKVDWSERLVYPSGGAGYVMNPIFVTMLMSSLRSQDTMRGIPDEDMALAINMLYQGVRPQRSCDLNGLQLFHPELPPTMYKLPNKTADWLFDNHKTIGGILRGPECCSPHSISFHHAGPIVLRYMNYRIYDCTGKDAV